MNFTQVYRVTLRYEITDAQLLIKTTPSETKVETEKNGLEIESHPIKMDIDNKDFFESIGIKSIGKVLDDAAEYGKQAVIKSMQRYADEKNAMLGPDGLTVAEIAAQRQIKTISSALDFIPDSKPEISWRDGYIDVNYVKDERNVQWTPPQVEYEYIPYSVKIIAERWAEEIEVPDIAE